MCLRVESLLEQCAVTTSIGIREIVKQNDLFGAAFRNVRDLEKTHDDCCLVLPKVLLE